MADRETPEADTATGGQQAGDGREGAPGEVEHREPPPTAAAPAETSGLERTRTSTFWTASVVAAVVLLLLLIFIVQNDESVEVSYFTFSGSLPLGVALMFAAVGGALLVVLVGAARILQLRRVARRRRKAERD